MTLVRMRSGRRAPARQRCAGRIRLRGGIAWLQMIRADRPDSIRHRLRAAIALALGRMP